MKIYSEVYEEIIQCPPVPPEMGGILGMKKGVVCACTYDQPPLQRDRAIYIPNVEFLNKRICEWKEQGISFCGMFHSHPFNQPKLSGEDNEYIKTIFQVMPETVRDLFFPIVLPNVMLLSFHAVRRENTIRIYEDKITIMKRSTNDEY